MVWHNRLGFVCAILGSAVLLATWQAPSAIGQLPSGSWTLDFEVYYDQGSHLQGLTRMRLLDDDGPGPNGEALFILGPFRYVHGIYSRCIARWDGYRWTGFGRGVGQEFFQSAYDASFFDPDGAGPIPRRLYVCGSFESVEGGVPARNLAWWDGAGWNPMFVGTSRIVNNMACFDPDLDGPAPPLLVLGGAAHPNDNLDGQGNAVVAWTGSEWLDIGYPRRVGSLYDSVVIDWMTQWNHDSSPETPPVLAICSYLQGELIRWQTSVIDYWDGFTWTSFPTPGGGATNSVAISPGTPNLPADALLVATYGGVYWWNGTEWLRIGRSSRPNYLSIVSSVAFFDSDADGPAPPLLLAAGILSDDNQSTPREGVVWNGTSWDRIGPQRPSSPDGFLAFDPDGAGPRRPMLLASGLLAESENGPWTPFAYLREEEVDWRCAADVTGDGLVGMADATAVLSSWGARDPRLDVSGDGIVNILDITLILKSWNASCL